MADYVTIDEFSSEINGPASVIKQWLKTGKFSEEVFFSISGVTRIHTRKAIEHLHASTSDKDEEWISKLLNFRDSIIANDLQSHAAELRDYFERNWTNKSTEKSMLSDSLAVFTELAVMSEGLELED